MFELKSALVRYFARGIKEWRRFSYRFRSPCIKRMQHRSYCKWFLAPRIIKASSNQILQENLDYFGKYTFAWNMIF